MSFESGEFFDLYQEIARSAFADMLHDHERNYKYFLALKKAIEKMHDRGLRANVLDIGTGTAILSMMAVKCGADSVTACEAFRPMADAAEKIIENNGMRDSIRLIKKRSIDIRVGGGADDMRQRANILVTEVFDTELIGEGAIETFNLAHRYLLEDDCIVVPDSGTIYVQTVESALAWAWNQPKVVANLDGDILLRTPTEINECNGSCELHDIQLNQFPTTQFRELIPPQPIFQFDFSGRSTISKSQHQIHHVSSQCNGSAQVFFLWWVLKMDQDGDIRISCAPHWSHEDFERLKTEKPNIRPIQNVIPWRDHWMQAVYYNPKILHVTEGEPLDLHCFRDEFSLWFELTRPNVETAVSIQSRPLCTCGFHLAYSRTRIGQLNDNLRTKKFLRIFDEKFDDKSTILLISEGSLIGLAIAAMKVRHVYLVDANQFSRQVLQKYIDFNKLTNVTLVEDVKDKTIPLSEVTHVVGEPNFVTAIVPWDNFRFGDFVNQIADQLNENAEIWPRSAEVVAMPIDCLDLNKIIAPFQVCESFDLTIFDRIIDQSHGMTDSTVEAQPLWEYPNIARSQPKTVYHRVFSRKQNENEKETDEINFETDEAFNAIAFWANYNFSDETNDKRKVFSSGPINQIETNALVEWDMHCRQGIHLYATPVGVSSKRTCTVKCTSDNSRSISQINIHVT